MSSKFRRALLCGGAHVAAIAGVAVLFAGAATGAQADVTISSEATQNMDCGSRICAPTATSAVLNVGDLEALLASGSVTVTTTGFGVQAGNIDVTAKLGWSANVLTLDAYQSLSVKAPVTVKGRSGLAILTDDGGSGGELAFSGKGHVTFKKLSASKLSASLAINGTSYRLVDSIAMLAAAIQKKPSGNYALASDLDASKDGTYSNSPIQATLVGAFEGLGNRISNLSIYVPTVGANLDFGLFEWSNGRISDLGVVGASVGAGRVKGRFAEALLGILAGGNGGTISRCYSSGTVSGGKHTFAGGLVSVNNGILTESHSSARVQAGIRFPTNGSYAGGLVAGNGGQITLSYATGSVESGQYAGGLVGFADTGSIANSYATGKVSGSGVGGGLVGYNLTSINTSYSTGKVESAFAGGLIGADESESGSLSDTYWDTTTSGITNLSQGAASPANDPGITGLTTEQLQSGLPAGFDPTVWRESANINGGLPYLLAIPPD